jgi:ABC-type amino acid transport substrate-binding protein
MDNTLAERRQDKCRYVAQILALHRGSKNQHADISQYADSDPPKNGPAGRKNHEVGLRGKVHGLNDLYNAKVGSVSQSEGFDFLTKQGIAVIPFEGIQDGLAAVASRKIDAFVLNEQVLKYQTKREFPGHVQVLPGIYDEYFVSIAVPQNSSLRRPINTALLRLMKTKNWIELRNRYIQ